MLATLFCLTGPIAAPSALAEDGVTKLHALTFLDKPKYGPDFTHLDYVNPAAPKGGSVTYAAVGSFDNFNPYIIKGNASALPGIYETLTTSPEDDVMSEYGLIAESMEQPADRSWIIFNLRPQA
ncbi:MAG TPA: ABC transporter substrate-binding protein, partial [Dongiaceae bacterium]